MTAPAGSGARVLRIDGLRRTVADLRRSIDFYCAGLGFEVADNGPAAPCGGTRLVLGSEYIDLVAAAGPGSLPPPAAANDRRFQHAAIVAADMEAAWRRLLGFAPARISTGAPQRLPASTGGVTAVKFRDPDGHPLELIHFPEGAGDPRWHGSPATQPTLGIDHFAIVVADLERSIAFYTGALGLRVKARGVNRGAEQDGLDGLGGVVVDVVAVEAEGGERAPHLELLAYRKPVAPMPRPAGNEAGAERDCLVCIGGKAQAQLADPDGHRLVLHGQSAPSR